MEQDNQFLKWATDLQSIAQAGLEYGKDIFDKERYEKVREIAGEMMQAQTGLPKEKIDTLFLGDEGYQTPKIDTRAAIFKDDKILLVRENLRKLGHYLVGGMIMTARLLKIVLKKQEKKLVESLNR